MDLKKSTLDFYNTAASGLAEKFEKIGSRRSVIAHAISLVQKRDPFVLEIGCAGGRDAEEILKHTSNYLGIDAAESFVRMARDRVPGARFELADMETCAFPKGIDVVISFATLFHSDKKILSDILKRIYEAMNPGGVICASLKWGETYQEFSKTDEFGTRRGYLYSQQDLREIAEQFEILENEPRKARDVVWLEVLLRKLSA